MTSLAAPGLVDGNGIIYAVIRRSTYFLTTFCERMRDIPFTYIHAPLVTQLKRAHPYRRYSQE